MTRSCSSATIAASAIFHSKYDRQEDDDADQEEDQARRAFVEMSLPQLGPMTWVLTSSRLTPNSLASASLDLLGLVGGERLGLRAHRVRSDRLHDDLAARRRRSTVARTASWRHRGDLTRNSAPPRNSMPRFSRSVSSDTIETTSSTAETAYQILRWPMKS